MAKRKGGPHQQGPTRPLMSPVMRGFKIFFLLLDQSIN